MRLWHEIANRSGFRYVPSVLQAMLDSGDPVQEHDVMFMEESVIFRTEQEAEMWRSH